jgi:hypothetical protein
MKKCAYCENEFESSVKRIYCCKQCGKYYHRDKHLQKRRSDQKYREKINEYERERVKKSGRKRDRKKHAEEEKIRYRRKNKIITDFDLKCAPKGSGCITKAGYKRIIRHDHPNSASAGAIFEHVFIMSEFLKRPLFKHERVHHKNGIRTDNRIENLELWSKSQPYGQRVEDKVKWCIDYLNQYDYEVKKKQS